MAREQLLILENSQHETVRTYQWRGERAVLYRHRGTGRVEIAPDQDTLTANEIPFETLLEFERNDLLGSHAIAVGDLKLKLAPLVTKTVPSVTLVEDGNEEFATITKRSAAVHAALLILAFVGSWMIGLFTEKQTDPVVVTIMQPPRPIEPIKTVKASERKIERKKLVTKAKVAQKTVKPKRTSLFAQRAKTHKQPRQQRTTVKMENLGALGALGGMKSGLSGSAGFNPSARNASLGTDLKAIGSGGAGGYERAVHGRALVSGAVGAGGTTGASGYATKGKGGGRPGYGNMSMVGGGGGFTMPLEEEALIEGGLDRDQIAAVIQRNLGQVIYCYERGLQKDASLAGRVAVNFVISATGSVSTAKVHNTSLGSAQVEGCIVNKLRAWRFPKPYGNVNVKVSYPFLLKRVG